MSGWARPTPIWRLAVIAIALFLLVEPCVAQTPRVAPPTGPRVVVPRSRAVPGDEIRMPVALGDAPDLGSVQMEFVYDATKLNVTSIERGAMLGEHATIESDIHSTPGRAIVRINSPQQPLSGDGELFKVRFAIDENAPQFGHKISVENIRAFRVVGSQGDGAAEQTEVRLGAFAGELRVINRPVSVWILGSIALVVVGVIVTSFKSSRPVVQEQASLEPVTVTA